MKKIKVRNAKLRDKGLFLKLYRKFAENEYKKDNNSPVTDSNLELYGRYFEAFVSGELEGVVLFFREHGFLMFGDLGASFEYEKKWAQSFGIYVDEEFRGKGVAQAMRVEAFKQLKEMGFEFIQATQKFENNEDAVKSAKASGFEIDSYVIKRYLNKEE